MNESAWDRDWHEAQKFVLEIGGTKFFALYGDE